MDERKDLSFQKHFQQLQQQLGIEQLTEQDIQSVLAQNDALCQDKHQPDLPVLELRIDGQSYVFNSLYRVWMIESIFSNVLEEKYKNYQLLIEYTPKNKNRAKPVFP